MSASPVVLINCYYYAPHNHCLLSRHLAEDLRFIRELGADAISVCVQEDQLVNWHQQRLRNVVALAHRHGLQVFAVPNRWAGLVAGWLDGLSRWTLAHADALIPSRKASGCCDPRHPQVRRHFEETLRVMFSKYDFDGLVWDEPRPAEQAVIGLLDEMSALARELKPGLVVSLFAEAGNLDLAPSLARTRHIDYLGADGHLRRESHRMHRMKNTIFTTHAAFAPVLRAAGKKTVFLLEAQRHRDEDLDEYLAVVDRAFDLAMDQLMFYFSAHEMSLDNEDAFNRATWNAVRRVAQRRWNFRGPFGILDSRRADVQ